MTGKLPGKLAAWIGGGMTIDWSAVIVALIAGSVPGALAWVTTRRRIVAMAPRTEAAAKATASRTTRQEFESLYKEMRAQLEDARRGWAACRSECTSLRLSLDLEEQKTEAQEVKIRELQENLKKETYERQHLQWVVSEMQEKSRGEKRAEEEKRAQQEDERKRRQR